MIVLLCESAAKLLETDHGVIDVALDCHYQPHEGYARIAIPALKR